MAACGHGPNENTIIEGVLAHPNPVTEDCTTGIGRGRIDGEDCHLFILRTHHGNKRRSERGLSRSWRSGDSHRRGVPSAPMGTPADHSRIDATALDHREQPSKRASISGTCGIEQLTGSGAVIIGHGETLRGDSRRSPAQELDGVRAKRGFPQ
jgi:hypothetical protein